MALIFSASRFGKRLDHLRRSGARFRGERLQFLDRALGGERLEPRELDAHAVTDERLLAEVGPQGVYGPAYRPSSGESAASDERHGPLL